MKSQSFERFAGKTAILAGIAAFIYSFAFVVLVVLKRAPEIGLFLASLLLLLGGIFSSIILNAIYHRVRETDSAFALWALFLGLAGAIGSAVHGGFDFANVMNPPKPLAADIIARPEIKALVDNLNGIPSEVDPRGLATFGLAGIALLVFAMLMGRVGTFPKNLVLLTYVSAILSIVLYLGRLILLDPMNPIVLLVAFLEGFIVSPVWNIWIGLTFIREKK